MTIRCHEQTHIWDSDEHRGAVEDCTEDECEMMHELLVICWCGTEAERRGYHHRPRARDDDCAIQEAVVTMVGVQMELF